jgi:hypothetical protein
MRFTPPKRPRPPRRARPDQAEAGRAVKETK